MKDKFTLEKINREKAYKKIRTQEFYSGDYAESWVDETPYKLLKHQNYPKICKRNTKNNCLC